MDSPVLHGACGCPCGPIAHWTPAESEALRRGWSRSFLCQSPLLLSPPPPPGSKEKLQDLIRHHKNLRQLIMIFITTDYL